MSSTPSTPSLTALVKTSYQFEGHHLTQVEYQGQPCWIAREVGAALGYDKGGGRFSQKITSAWAAEFTDGQDYHRLSGPELASLAALLDAPESGASRHGGLRYQILLLTESGVWLGCILSRKPAGRRLRRWLATEVLPQLRQTGSYGLDAPPPPAAPPACLPADLSTMAPEDRWWRVQALREVTAQQHALRLIDAEALRFRYDLIASLAGGVPLGVCRG